MLAEIVGVARYLALKGFNYAKPLVPPLTHTEITARRNSHNTALLTAENEEEWQHFAIVTGFRKGMGDNIRNVLDSCYYNQLQHCVLKYRNVTPIQYLDHLTNQ